MKKEYLEMQELLIVVDMVNGFIKKGAMADPYIASIITRQIEMLEEQLKNKGGIAFIKDCHLENCEEFNRYPKHCIKGTEESKIVDELKKYINYSLIYEKNSTSVMFAPNFMSDIVKLEKLKKVVIVGCCTDICVINLALPLRNYFDEQNKNIVIEVATDAVETYGAPNHNRELYNDMAFKLMEQAGIVLTKKKKRGKNYAKQNIND